MASHGRIMRYAFVFCVAIIILASSSGIACCSFFKNGYYPQPYNYCIDTFPEIKSYTAPGIIITESDAGRYIVTTPGECINISLMETDPYNDWLPAEWDGTTYKENDVMDSYPVRHIFTLKANESSVIQLRLVDSRTGKTSRTFEFYLVVGEPTSGTGWPKFSADLVPSFVWPLQLKF